MEVTAALLLFLGLSLVVLLAVRGRGGSGGGRLPPGPTPLPLIGNLLQISPSQTLKSLLKLRDKYGPVFTVYLGTRRVVVLCGHEAVHEALVGHAEEFAGRGRMPTVERTFHGHGVVFANGERWKQLRRFSLTVLRDFGMGRHSLEGPIQEEAQCLVQEMRNTQGKPFDPTYMLSRAVSNIICAMVFGKRFDYNDAELLELLQMMNESFREISTPAAQLYEMSETLLQYFPGPQDKIYALLESMRSFIARRVRCNAQSLEPSNPRDFIDCFLLQMEKEKNNPNSEFTMENLELTALNLFFAGTETISSTLRYAFVLLMKNPSVLEKVHAEIDAVIGRERPPRVEDRPSMPYSDAVIHEVQRCADLIPMNVPHRVVRDTEFRGFLLPKGTDVYPLLSTALHDPAMFKFPDCFNPSNFLDSSGRFQKNDAFVPFSSGKRLCLGESLARMELFLFLTTILQHFQLQPLQPPEQLSDQPLESGFANIPPLFQLKVLPR
jgi:cytochrome P450